MTDDAQPLAEQCGTSAHATEALLYNRQEQKFKQAMASSYLAPGALEGKYSQIYDLDQEDQMYIREDGTQVFKLHERYASIYCTTTARAAMARSIDSQTEESTDESLGVMDCGASITITGSLINCVDVEEHKTIIETAKEGESIVATHTCRKTYFVKNRVGDMVFITTSALYVKGFVQDLIAGKSLNREKIRIILDEDPDVSGLYPLNDQKEARYQDSIPFISEPSDLFYLKIEQMDWTRFERMTGYDLWHRRLGHTPNKFIKLSIEHSIGLEKLNGKKFSEHQKCPSCMIGKSQLNDKPESIKRAEKPLAKVNFDLISSSVTSIEGYNYCAVFTDDCSEYRWAYGLKTKDELVDAVKQWYAEIADLREKYQLLVVMRDFAGENMSQEIQDFFTDKGVKSYFSTPYESWQDGLGEAGIKSVLLLARTEMAESGLAGRYWFSAVNHHDGKNCRNVTFKYRLGTTPYARIYGVKKDVSKFRPFGCRAYVHLNKDRREKGKHTPRAVEAIHLGFASDCNMSAYKFYIPLSGKCIISNQARFDEESFPYRNQDMIKGKLDADNDLDVLSADKRPTRWIDFTPDTDK
jgi:hypothetical protein